VPRPADYDRIRAALATLARLDAVRGTVIRAEDWNALVSTVADLARATLAETETQVVPPHEHLAEVTIDWLAPPLRALVERGPLADPAQQTRLAGIEQTLKRLRDARDADEQRATDLRGRLDEVATRDLERQAQVTRIGRQVDQVLDPRDELATMRGSLGSVQSGMAKVIEAAARLSENGEVIDLAALRGRVTELETLRERLQGAQGELLDAGAIERRIAEIAETAVSQEELQEALKKVRSRPNANLGELETRLGTTLREQFEGRLEGLSGELSGRIEERLQGLDQLVAGRIGAALPEVETRLSGSFEARLAAVRDEAVASATQTGEQRLGAGLDTIRETLDERLTAQDAAIAAQVRSEVAGRLAADLGDLRSSLAAADGRIAAFERSLGEVQAARETDARSLAAVPQQLAQLRAELRTTILAEAQTRADATQAVVDQQLAALAQAQQERLATLATQLNQAAVDVARQAAQAAAQGEFRSARVGLLAEVRGIAREEVTIGLRERPAGGGIGGVNGRIDPDVLRPDTPIVRGGPGG